jgi:hypothetical protein
MTARAVVQSASLPSRPKRGSRLVLMVESGRWPFILYAAAAATAIAFPAYQSLSPWFGVGVFALVVTLGHLIAVSHRIPWLPGLVILIAGLQWILAPALVYSLPSVPTAIPAAVSAETYFQFVVPGFLAFTAGLFVPMIGAGAGAFRGPVTDSMSPEQRTRFITTSKKLAIAGIAAHVLAFGGVPGGARFVVDIVGRLTLVGALCLLLVRAPGWRTWCVGALALQAFDSIVSSLFIGLFIQALHLGLLTTFRMKVPLRRIAAMAVAGVVILFAVNGFKGAYRQNMEGLDASERVGVASQQFWSILTNPDRLFSPENLAFNLSRLNQGSITARVLYWTPQFEPFAHGETVITALRAALLPRVLDPAKITAGGGDNYPRFTGLALLHGTSINLSALGEFYANYGEAGAWVAIFVWGAFITTIYRLVFNRARTSVVWWAWIPFIMPSVLSAESGLVELLNEVSKSSLVMLAIVYTVPSWRGLIRGRRPRPQSSPRPRA